MRALVVEDEAIISLMVSQELEDVGWEVVVVSDAASALRELSFSEAEHRSFDVVVLDLGLPDTTGCELALALWYLLPSIKIIVHTGYSLLSIRHDGLPLEVPVIEKPSAYGRLAETAARSIAHT